MNGLMLHCGANRVSHDQVAHATTPQGTWTHRPIPHEYLIRSLFQNIERLGFKLQEAAHALSHNDNRYFGLFRFERPVSGDDVGKPYGVVVGLRNSHDKTFPAGLVIGASVFVCDNLSFSGEISLARKHTTHILRNLPWKVQQTVGQLPQALEAQDRRFAAYQNHGLSRSEVNDIIVRAYEAGACTTSQIGKILKEYKDPRHPEFRDRNAWSLFNAFTEVQKGALGLLPARTQALHSVLDSHTGVEFNTTTDYWNSTGPRSRYAAAMKRAEEIVATAH